MNRSPITIVRNAAKDCRMNANGSLLSTTDTFGVGKRSATVCVHGLTMTNYNDTNIHVKRPEIARNIIKNSDIVCFDVDSTVIMDEGIDELAEFCGKGPEVSRLTKEAMGGSMTFQEALKMRLDIIQPSWQQVTDFLEQRPSRLTKGVKRFVSHLKANGKQVFLISGGFHCLIDPVAVKLDIPTSNVFANSLHFYTEGDYAHFDKNEPTSRSGGKSEVVAIIKRMNPNSLITMIGDGATDLEAVPPADFFIGFGGNIVRPEVFNKAQCYVTAFDQLWSK